MFYLLSSIFLIVVLSFNVTAVEDQRPSLFDDISKFFNSMFQGEKRVINEVPLPKEEIKQIRLIDLERLELLIGFSDCLKQLPKPSAIKLKIFDEDSNKNEFFISNGLKIDLYSGQKTDLKVGLSLKDILSLEKSINVDGELRSLINSENLELDYNIFRALKYRNVLSCIKDSEIVIEEPEEKIDLEGTQEDTPINETQENVTLVDIEPVKVTIINKEELNPKKLKFFLDDFENNVPYTIIADDISDYSNLRAINLFSNWNYAINSIDYNSVDEEDISKKNLIFISIGCENNISLLNLNESECQNELEDKKGIISYYNENSRNILFVIGDNSQDLVDSVIILSNYWLFDFNDSESLSTDDDMYNIANIPNRLNEIIDELKSIQIKTLDIGRPLQFTNEYDPGSLVISYISGDKFRYVFDHIDGYRASDENKQKVREFDSAELIRKGDEFESKRSAVNAKIRILKLLISAPLKTKIDENILNLESLEKYENTLETAQNNFASLEKENNELLELGDEIIPEYVKIQQLLGRNIVYIR